MGFKINNIKKPSTPYVLNSQITLTEEEHTRRMYADKQLAELGISTSVFDGNESENAYILEAIIIANQGKTIPEELKQKIKNLEKR